MTIKQFLATRIYTGNIEKEVGKKVSFLSEKVNDTISDLGFNFLGYWLGTLYIAGKLGGII